MLEIRQVATVADGQAARELILGLIAWLRELFADDAGPIDEYFIAIQPELASLPGEYAPPDGHMLLACLDGRPVGLAALRRLDAQTCEMKRMFVQASARGTGVGRALALALLDAARRSGYARMRLDTSRRQDAAIRLYRNLGFTEIAPYYEVSATLRATMHYMELPLGASPAGRA